MKRFNLLATGFGLVLATGVLLAQAQEKAGGKIIKPAPPVVVASTPFELKVETKPRFPNENRPQASTPAEEKSLAVTIQPEKTEFAGNGPLALLVTFENKSKSPLILYGLEHLGASPKLVVSNQKSASQWSVTGDFSKAPDQAAAELGAGESKTYTLVIEANAVVVPQPIPFPMPRPIPLPAGAVLEDLKPGPPPAVRRIVPPRPPVVIGPALPVGEGACRAMLLLEFPSDPARKYQHPVWTGKIASRTVDFQVGKAQPVAVPPVVGGAMTKAQAITVAKAAAERALQVNYQPQGTVKPAHQGEWIKEAEKTANVTESKTGGWTIAWTHFPKSGFSYNVKVDVGQNGSANVREVFASYSE